MVRCAWIVVWLMTATAAFGKAHVLSGGAIKHLVSGAIMYINTPLNSKIPVRYGEDGALAGAAGSMAFYLGAAKDTGRWWVERGRLCHKWKRWFDGETQCLRLRKNGNRIFWASDSGRSGTAMIHRSKPRQHQALAAKTAPATRRTASNTHQKSNTKQVAKPPVRYARASLGAISGAAPKTATTNSARRTDARPTPVAKKTSRVKSSVTRSKTPTQKKVTANKVQRPGRAAGSSRALRQTAWRTQPLYRVANVAPVDVLNIRQGPSEYHPIVGRIPPAGRGVKITGVCQAWWCPVAHGDVTGWVNRFYLVADSTNR